jgi:3-hydroxybutyryl-CoA dehydrogenase
MINSNKSIGVVGLGLMGSSIVVSLLASGFPVVALAPIPDEKSLAVQRIVDLLRHANDCNLLSKGLEACVQALKVTENYQDLAHCMLIQECVIEDIAIKKKVYDHITSSVSVDTIIATNTSAIPISELQQYVVNPRRFIGIHWAEPAYMTRFLEVTCGKETAVDLAEYVVELGKQWQKEPTLLRKDIRGFITNRLMYAVYREALTLVENGYTTIEDADKAFRYDIGSWITLMGIFRRLDFVGLEDYIVAFERIIRVLSNRTDIPEIMKPMVSEKARGVHNCHGLYSYNEEEAKAWETAFAKFNRDIYELASKYGEHQLLEMLRV